MRNMLATFACVLVAGTLSFTIAQENVPTKDELLQTVPQLRNIPAFADFNMSSVKTEDFEKLSREKCEKNGGPTAFNAAKEGPASFGTCLQSLLNVTELQSEMDAARPHGELDVVFKKYCHRVPNLKNCVKNLTDTMEPCLDMDERESVKIVHNITSSLLEFICHNEGDRIAMFIAAGGIECFKNNQQNVSICANETFGSYIPAANTPGGIVPSISTIPQLVLGLKECTDIEKFKTCTVVVLEQCKDPTPANVVESLLNFVKKVTPCKDILSTEEAARVGTNLSSPTSVVNILLITTAMVMSLRFA